MTCSGKSSKSANQMFNEFTNILAFLQIIEINQLTALSCFLLPRFPWQAEEYSPSSPLFVFLQFSWNISGPLMLDRWEEGSCPSFSPYILPDVPISNSWTWIKGDLNLRLLQNLNSDLLISSYICSFVCIFADLFCSLLALRTTVLFANFMNNNFLNDSW